MATFNQNEFFKLLNDIVQEIIRRHGFLDESDLSISNDQDSDFDERIYDDGKLLTLDTLFYARVLFLHFTNFDRGHPTVDGSDLTFAL